MKIYLCNIAPRQFIYLRRCWNGSQSYRSATRDSWDASLAKVLLSCPPNILYINCYIFY